MALSPHEVRLRPAPHCRTPILSYSLKVEPEQHFLNWQQDVYGNFIARFVFSEKARELEMIVDLTADLAPINPFDFFLEPSAVAYPFVYESWLESELAPYLHRLLKQPRNLLLKLLEAVPSGERRELTLRPFAQLYEPCIIGLVLTLKPRHLRELLAQRFVCAGSGKLGGLKFTRREIDEGEADGDGGAKRHAAAQPPQPDEHGHEEQRLLGRRAHQRPEGGQHPALFLHGEHGAHGCG